MNVDFLKQLDAGANLFYGIVDIERNGYDLRVVIECLADDTKSTISFHNVSCFEHTLFGAPGDSDKLPQNLIGFDYWQTPDDEAGIYRWEINGDECTWNFRAPLPNVPARLSLGGT